MATQFSLPKKKSGSTSDVAQDGSSLGFFLTPIIYSLDLVTTKAGQGLKGQVFYTVLRVNPMAWIAIGFQDVIAFNRLPVHWHGLLYSAAVSLIMLVIGVVVFERLQGKFAEEL